MKELTIINTRLSEAITEYKMLCDTVECIDITDDATLKNGIEMGSKINKFEKALEEKRKEAVKPYNDEVKKINGLFKPIVDNVSALNAKMKSKILEYQKIVEARRKAWVEEQRKKEIEEMEARKNEMLEIAVESDNDLALDIAGNIEAEQKAIAEKEVNVKTIVKTEEAKSSIRRTWDFEVVDAGLIPREYLMVDERAIKQAIKDRKIEIEAGTFTIKGVKFYEKESISF